MDANKSGGPPPLPGSSPPPLPSSGPPPLPVRSPPLQASQPPLSEKLQQSQGGKPPQDLSSEHVRQSLRRYNKHTNATCLECGYSGLMGVKKSNRPWYLSWWVVIPLVLVITQFVGLFGGFFIGLFIALAMSHFLKHEMECPSCGAELEETERL